MKKHSDITPDFLFHIAQGFYEIAYSVSVKLKHDQSVSGFQRIAPAVVNFSFTLELLLKGLFAITNKSDMTGHKLYDLYNQLPTHIKAEIDKKYRVHIQKSGDELTKIRIVMSRVTEQENSKNKDSKIYDSMSIENLLKIHNDSFINWRYLYETKIDGYEYEFDFKLINCLVKSIIEVVNEVKSNQAPTFVLKKPNQKI